MKENSHNKVRIGHFKRFHQYLYQSLSELSLYMDSMIAHLSYLPLEMRMPLIPLSSVCLQNHHPLDTNFRWHTNDIKSSKLSQKFFFSFNQLLKTCSKIYTRVSDTSKNVKKLLFGDRYYKLQYQTE